MPNKFLSKTQDDGAVTFTLGNGQSLKVVANDLPEAIQTEAMLHGLKQKIGDAASGFAKNRDHAGAYDAMSAVIAALTSGDWNRKPTASVSDLAQALANLSGKPIDKAREVVAKADDELLDKMKKDPHLKAEVKRIQAERAEQAAAKSEFDLGTLLGDQ